MTSVNPTQIFNMHGKTALVTGASGALGERFVRTLAAAGATVIGTSRQAQHAVLEQLAADLGDQFITAELDVTDSASIEALLQVAYARQASLDVLINNAGVASSAAAIDLADSAWDGVIATNLTGPWTLAQRWARQQITREQGGSLINIASLLASRVTKGVAPYAAAKAALRHVSEALALEWGRYNIRVNTISPGYIESAMTRQLLQGAEGQATVQRQPRRVAGQPEDLDGVILLLASDASRHITGTDIIVDGGHHCAAL